MTRLSSFYEAQTSDGHIVCPYGSHRRGQLIYDQHGNMAVQIARFQREGFSADDKLQGTLEEFTGAFTSCELILGRM